MHERSYNYPRVTELRRPVAPPDPRPAAGADQRSLVIASLMRCPPKHSGTGRRAR
jgi:hypothetical protein